jgi:hypothetical protein
VSRAPASPISRRTTLGGALVGVAALAGCDLGGSGPASSPTPPAGSADPDAELVEAVKDDIVATSVLVDALGRRHGSLRRPLAELARVHEAHLEVLGSREPTGERPPRTRSAAEALALLRKRELRHQRLLADHALSARSGRLARVLASMSAAIAQQLTLLPEGKDR